MCDVLSGLNSAVCANKYVGLSKDILPALTILYNL